MVKSKILGTGLSGLVGSRIVELLNNYFEFENISIKSGVDITDKEEVFKKIKKSNAEVLIHLAAKTDVDACEKDRVEDVKTLKSKDINLQEKDFKNKKTAWAINVFGTQNIVEACKKTNKKLIYFSTDFVFNGKNPPKHGYTEEDIPNPINWYSLTKYKAEKIVEETDPNFVIARISYPYRAFFNKKDFLRAMISFFKNKTNLQVVDGQIMTPTFIDDIANAVHLLIKNNSSGIFHVVGSQFITPYDTALLIAEEFNFDKSLVLKTTYEDFYRGRAKRPFDLPVKNDKIQKLGVGMKTFKEGLNEVKFQLEKFKNII